jgi:Cysteine-rich secretory protein family
VFSPRQLVGAGLAAAAVFVAASSPDQAAAATCAGASAEPGEASRATLARALICAINTERHRHGLGVVRQNSRLKRAALGHSRDLVARHYFEHTTPEGSTVSQRIRRTGYLGSARRWIAGENLAWGPGRITWRAEARRARLDAQPQAPARAPPAFLPGGRGGCDMGRAKPAWTAGRDLHR